MTERERQLVGRLDPDQLRLLRARVLEQVANAYLNAPGVDGLADLEDLVVLARAIDRKLGIHDPPATLARRAMLAVEAGTYKGA